METWTFESDLLPSTILQCESEIGREIEKALLMNIREYECIGDDKVMPNHYPVDWIVGMDEFGITLKTTYAADRAGRKIGFRVDHPVVDLEADLWKLRPVEIHVDREASVRRADTIREVLGDTMPVIMRGTPPLVSLTEKAVYLMGMENLFIALYEQPEQVHRLMRYLTDNQIAIMRFYEKEGLLTPNNGNQESGPSSYGFTNRLSGEYPATLKQVWMWAEAEETAPISSEMFAGFFLPYFAEAAALVGLVYYGCCEPLHNVYPHIIKAIPNTRKVSVSPWCDQVIMGDYLRGSDVVFSRKPEANYLGLGAKLDEDAWRGHIRQTLDAARGCQCEIIMRDIYQVKNLEAVKRAVSISREEACRQT